MEPKRVEKIKELWKQIHGNIVPAFDWQFHPNMYYWYNTELDCIECDCGLTLPITLKDEELNENNLTELIWNMENKIYADYKRIGWELGYRYD